MNLGPVKETVTTEDSESLLINLRFTTISFLWSEKIVWREEEWTQQKTILANSIFGTCNYCWCRTFFSVAGHILGIRRTRLSNENYKSMLFAKVNFDLYDAQHVVGNKRLKL